MNNTGNKTLDRKLGLAALTATGICSMIGASIHVVPFMIQKNLPGIGPWVVPAFLMAALPAALAAVAYAALSAAMPRAGGSYLFASRGLSPAAGFIASFSQWFGLSVAIGVISYIIPAFIRDLFLSSGLEAIANGVTGPIVRPVLSIVILWLFVYINIRGAKTYSRILLPLMWLMFASGIVVMVAALLYEPMLFSVATDRTPAGIFNLEIFLSAVAVMFASYIGFDSIAQAGGEAEDPRKNLPRAIGRAVGGVTLFYVLFTISVYYLIPWQYVAEQSQQKDVTAPGLLSAVLPPVWTIPILAGAAIALLNDLPGMLLSVSRLLFAWGKDGIFPKYSASIHTKFRTPHIALIISGMMATVGILGSHFAGSFFLGIDIMVTAMLVNYLLMCITLLTIRRRNPELGKAVNLFSERTLKITGIAGTVVLLLFLIIHLKKDLQAEVSTWYFRSTWVYLIVMVTGLLIFYSGRKNTSKSFSELPD